MQYIVSLGLGMVLLSATLAGVQGTETQQVCKEQTPSLVLGVNYIPHVTCVEDFSPYWVEDKWTKERMAEDLKIMKAIGCNAVRFHIYPAGSEMEAFPGVDPNKFLPMLEFAIEVCQDLGLQMHLDIGHHIENISEEDVRRYVSLARGRIQSYQIGNEVYEDWRESGNLDKLERLVRVIKELDPKAQVSADILPEDCEFIRDKRPSLWKLLDFLPVHYYSLTDYRGWNDVYLEDLLDYIAGKGERFELKPPF